MGVCNNQTVSGCTNSIYSQGANGRKIGSRGKLVMIYNDHFRWTKGTLQNTETHVASPGNGAEIFSEHI